MKKLLAIAAFALAVFASNAEASCRFHSITQGGRTLSCTTCCYAGICNTHCS